MGKDNWPGSTLLVGLSGGSDMTAEIEKVIQLVREREDIDVVMDFSRVSAMSSACTADLLRLRKLLRANRRRLILSNVGAVTRAILSVSGLDAVFEIVSDRRDALATIRSRPDAPSLPVSNRAGKPSFSETAGTNP